MLNLFFTVPPVQMSTPLLSAKPRKECKCRRVGLHPHSSKVHSVRVRILSNVETIEKRMEKAGDKKVWPRVPDIEVHSYRSEYCTEIYNTFARP